MDSVNHHADALSNPSRHKICSGYVLVEQNALDALDLAARAYILSAGKNHTSGKASALAADKDIRRTFLGANSTEG